MTERYLLDTNIISDVIRNPRGLAARRIRQVGVAQVCTSIIVAAELRYGIAKRRTSTLATRVLEMLDRLAVLSLEPPADAVYAQLRVQLEETGTLIGPNDLLIAAQALSLGLVLVTDNEREFSRVPGLTIENWLR
ncbi:MAG TPA: type II toxin-antitoxin system VapC family toxin [Stellaceae bacterium]|nr:type II toxin-antitoxin system VapC family toxin [Stellaceae bacterium]